MGLRIEQRTEADQQGRTTDRAKHHPLPYDCQQVSAASQRLWIVGTRRVECCTEPTLCCAGVGLRLQWSAVEWRIQSNLEPLRSLIFNSIATTAIT